MPAHQWVSAVIEAARVSEVDMETYCGRARLHVFLNDEMPVWMAASTLRQFVVGGKRHDRADDEIASLTARMAVRHV